MEENRIIIQIIDVLQNKINSHNLGKKTMYTNKSQILIPRVKL